jgi:hypothetical protein
VAVDVINIGQFDEEHLKKLRSFHENVNNTDNSHFFSFPPTLESLSD